MTDVLKLGFGSFVVPAKGALAVFCNEELKFGPATRKALGRYGRGTLGRRQLDVGAIGWDVAELQFSLAWHGFPSGLLDGRFGPRTHAALRMFQTWAGIAAR